MDATHNISPGLASLAVPIDSLVEDPANVRRHPEQQLEALKAALRVHGQMKCIVVQKQGQIVRAGNLTFAAARALGWTHIAANVKEMTDLEAVAYAIADNRIGDMSEFDDDDLARLVDRLNLLDDDDLLAASGFTADDVERMLAELEEDAAELEDPAPEAPRPRADGDGGGEPDPVTGLPPAAPTSHVRMVQLFLSDETLPGFKSHCRLLAEHYGTGTVTDTVLRTLEEAVESNGLLAKA